MSPEPEIEYLREENAALTMEVEYVRGVCKELRTELEEMRHIEGRLRGAMLQAEEANVAKGEFLANMSHEIRTPMSAILGFADLLTEPDLSKREVGECVDTIRRNGEHLLTILNDILDLSKLEAGRVSMEVQPIAPVEILDGVVGLLRVHSDAKGLELRTVCTTPVPETIQSDSTRVRQVLLNLVGNAIKFTDEGFVEVRLSVSNENPAEPRLIFEVEDTGIGMSQEELQTVFDAFRQADNSTTRRFGGTGLGLAISKRFVELLGGELQVHSVRGSGSIFTVSFATGDLAGVPLVEGAATVPRSSGRA